MGLGLGKVAAFDIRQQCSGFLYALDLADAMIASGRVEVAVVVGAEAVVLRRGEREDEGLLATSLHTDGTGLELIWVPGVGFKERPYVSHEQIDQAAHLPRMDGGSLFRSAVRTMPEAAREVAARAGVTIEEIDIVVAHQANDRILEGVRRQFELSPEKVPSNIGSYGNTTAATLPILYHELREAGRVGPGKLVCFAAFGSGAHYGAALYPEPPGQGT